ncbi:MAG: hypothetical protein JWM37_587 [Candidatus Saccharibacteria bacterium]|nr:hypothetical protein [Candidatus Saccharibacteria bacterium]
MPPAPHPNDPVWLSREEYDRLRQQAAYNAVPLVVPAPPQAKTNTVGTTVAAVTAIGLLIALTTHMTGIFLICLPVLIVITLISWVKSIRAKNDGSIRSKITVTALAIIIILLILALLAFAPFILLIFFVMAGGGIG